ncbi:MAG: SDR family oxidoreductase [Chitinophagaceae bacterium]|nr:SDR family oxidoreductase [Chitinophagaceae bacterium]
MVAEFKNRNEWALILGGSAGLGLASAKKLAMHGLNIIIVHRNSRADTPQLEKEFDLIKANEVECLSFNKDAMSVEKRNLMIDAVKAKLGTEGKIKVLIHSIAKGNLKPMVDGENPTLQNDDFHVTLESMAISLYDWTKLIFGSKLFAADARIISFTSEGNKKAFPGYGAVSVAKAALEAITRNIALEFAPFGIKANCIQAGVTDTVSFRAIPGHEILEKASLHRNPFKRLTRPEDVANVVYLLCKEEAAWINGNIIIVDGGEHIN